ncbi:MAG: sensor histidine kinase [Thermodesulfobacteriota bacterium]
MRKEIVKDLQLSEQDSAVLDMHSLYNILTILAGELQMIEAVAGEDGALRASTVQVFQVKDNLRNTASALEDARNMESILAGINEAVQELLRNSPHLQDDPDIQESVANIVSAGDILCVRSKELVARCDASEQWTVHDIQSLRQNFIDVFAAIEKNSKGRYRFVYNLAQHTDDAYFIALALEGDRAEQILMPPVMQDVMRDLIANARKYTNPGGKVLAGLAEDATTLRFAVEDTGWGIPEQELEAVVEFGVRGTNVQDKPSMGGGFGLTKAYWATKCFQGRMWLASTEGQGTRVDIQIPKP